MTKEDPQLQNLELEKQTIVENDYIHFSLQGPIQGKYLVHCDVYEWSKDTYKMLLDWWQEIISQFYLHEIDELFVLLPEEEKKIAKFAVKFGFEPISCAEYQLENGESGLLFLYRFPIKETVETSPTASDEEI